AHMNVKHAARLTLSSTGSYTVHETILPTGTLVRQYVSKSGVVFAVAWSGSFVPDLRQLLGPHFDTMTARQAKRVHAGHRLVSQHESDLVIESGGHPRSFVGRAYLPSALPAGVVEKDIQYERPRIQLACVVWRCICSSIIPIGLVITEMRLFLMDYLG